jgi:hypothetical protein
MTAGAFEKQLARPTFGASSSISARRMHRLSPKKRSSASDSCMRLKAKSVAARQSNVNRCVRREPVLY